MSLINFFKFRKFNYILFLNLFFFILLTYSLEGLLHYKQAKLKININNYEKKIKENNKRLFKDFTKKNYDTRNRLEFFRDTKNKNPAVSIPPIENINKIGNIFPLSGISKSRTIGCNENGYFSIYESDRYGFNNPDNEWNNNEHEFILIGDSFTWGACVNRPFDISSQLRKITGKSVINLGYSGNGPLIEYATLKEYLPKKAKKIIWIYFDGNDNSNLIAELSNPTLKNYLMNKNFRQNLKNKTDDIDNLLKEKIKKDFKMNNKFNDDIKFQSSFSLNEFIVFSKLRGLIEVKFNKTNIMYYQNNLIYKDLKNIFLNVKEFSNKNNSRLYFVYLGLPETVEYFKILNTSYNQKNFNKVNLIMQELDIPILNLNLELSRNKKNYNHLFPFGNYGHFNEEGYKSIANLIHNFANNN